MIQCAQQPCIKPLAEGGGSFLHGTRQPCCSFPALSPPCLPACQACRGCSAASFSACESTFLLLLIFPQPLYTEVEITPPPPPPPQPVSLCPIIIYLCKGFSINYSRPDPKFTPFLRNNHCSQLQNASQTKGLQWATEAAINTPATLHPTIHIPP